MTAAEGTRLKAATVMTPLGLKSPIFSSALTAGSGSAVTAWPDYVIDAIQRSAKTGKIGDGKAFVLNVDEALRIRTGERGESAI